MVGFTLLSRSYYYLRRRSPGPPFPPDHRQAGERGAIKREYFTIKLYIESPLPFLLRWPVRCRVSPLHLTGEGGGTARRVLARHPLCVWMDTIAQTQILDLMVSPAVIWSVLNLGPGRHQTHGPRKICNAIVTLSLIHI